MYSAPKKTFQNERFSPPADRTTTERFNPAVHGFDGVNTVSLPGFARGSDTVVIKAASESKEFPFNIDMNSGNPLGIGNYNLCGALGTSTHFFFEGGPSQLSKTAQEAAPLHPTWRHNSWVVQICTSC
jgi:hypothetical protein